MDTPIHKLYKFGAETAAFRFEKQGYLTPMWIGVNKRGSHTPMIISDMSDKDKVAETIKAFLKKEGVTRYVSMLECWTLATKGRVPREVAEGKSIEHHPDRREAINILAEDTDGTIVSGHYYILRPEHGKPKLSPLKTHKEKTKTEGRFVRMFD